MTVQLTAATAGVFSGRISIGNNSNENPFTLGVTGTVLTPAAEIQVLNGTADLPDDTGAVNLGTAAVGGKTVAHTFTVQNLGNTNLTLGAIVAPGFLVASGFVSTTLAPGASTTFTLALKTSALGSFSGKVSFANNDSDENPFNFTVTGAVNLTSTAPMVRDDSLTRQIDEGGVATLRGHLVDPDPQDDLFLTIDWADGSPVETHKVGHAPFSFRHRYLDDAPAGASDDFQVHFTWFDSGGGSNSKSLPVTVLNVAPQVCLGPPVHLRTDETLTRVGTFSDPGLDSWYATVDYRDGHGAEWLPLGADRRFTLSHRYSAPGVYQVRVSIFDDDGGVGTATLVVTVQNASKGGGICGDGVKPHPGHSVDTGGDTGRPPKSRGDDSRPQPLAVQPRWQFFFVPGHTKPGRHSVTMFDDDDRA
jgi:hypothetical protein